jgi:hypothetical protein
MRTYNELVIEFSTWGSEEKQKWVDKLPIEEIKVPINGLSNVAYTGIWDSWIRYMEMIEEERARKLKELGI